MTDKDYKYAAIIFSPTSIFSYIYFSTCYFNVQLVIACLLYILRKNNPDNRVDSFHEWLITAYKFDLLVPTRKYPFVLNK